jgi:thiosulfate/3-mercaptopyruvate sulfurtransferase
MAKIDTAGRSRPMVERHSPFGTGVVKGVTAAWLEEHLREEKLIILDAQPDIHDYIRHHIPRAVYFPEKVLRLPLNGMPGKWIDDGMAQLVLRRLGLDASTPIVVYSGRGQFTGWGDGLGQTMVAYTLARFGCEKVHVLDGGLDKWLEEGRPTSQEFPRVKPTRMKARTQSEMFMDLGEFRKAKDRTDTVVVDARPAQAYTGERGPWIRNGHIPGAVNVPWRELMHADNPHRLRPEEEIERLFVDRGVTRDRLVICTCGTGREATSEYIILKYYLGYRRVRLYEGSFTEWVSYAENPIVRGELPREEKKAA